MTTRDSILCGNSAHVGNGCKQQYCV